MNRKIVYVGFEFPHHKGTHAGYHQIKKVLNYDYVIDCQKYFEKCQSPVHAIILRVKRRIVNKLLGTNVVPWYLFRIIWLGLLHNNLTFHFIYGENIFFPWVKFFLRKGNVVVCTFHQPYSCFEKDEKRKKLILKSDSIILVGKSEVELFEKMTGMKNVFFIPHGIDTNFYHPDPSIIKEHVVLTVGNWLRDYEFADRIYMKLLSMDDKLIVNVVSNIHNEKKLTKHKRLHFYTGITDDELLRLYQSCEVLFLPLCRYTANNSLLEASATGCKIVISSDYQDNSYIPSSLLTLVPMDEDIVVKAILELMNKSLYETLSSYVDEHYSWIAVADKIKSVLYRGEIKTPKFTH